MEWQPTLGAWPEKGGTRFRVWAPDRNSVEVVIESPGKATAAHALQKDRDGYWTGILDQVGPGDRYRYRLDGAGPFPDPASRFQPDGVHGPSQVVDPRSFRWSDERWQGMPLEKMVIYEMHVGTFTPEGTYAGLMERLPYLADLGVTALELLPLADFPGLRNWGYDGVDLFAPARCYGTPDDLRRLVDAAHRHGIAVLLDVVYNHLGPDGNYLSQFSPYYFAKEGTEWGEGPNFVGEHNEQVRHFFIENALYWLNEYHFDGLRLDATHVLPEGGPRPFLAEFTERIRAQLPRPVVLIAEDFRNLDTLIRPVAEGGWGLDAVWADDFHHEVRVHLAGDHEGHYRDYTGAIDDLAATMRQGWFYTGQHSTHNDMARGTDPKGIPLPRFVWCIQNHDQIGNRAMGERLNHQIDPAAYRAASTLLLTGPATPMLYMGQEWGSSSPFLFFTHHNPELGKLVTEGRRREFRHFESFRNAEAAARIPDPQADATFEASKLQWKELEREPHASLHRYYRALLNLRKREPALGGDTEVDVCDPRSLVCIRRAGAERIAVFVHLGGESATVQSQAAELQNRGWEVLLTSEDQGFCADRAPAEIDLNGSTPKIKFNRAGAVVLKARA